MGCAKVRRRRGEARRNGGARRGGLVLRLRRRARGSLLATLLGHHLLLLDVRSPLSAVLALPLCHGSGGSSRIGRRRARRSGRWHRGRRTRLRVGRGRVHAVAGLRRRRARRSVGPVLAPRALEAAAVHHRAVEVDDGVGSVLVRVELDKGEAAVGLHADLDDVAEALEERDEVGLGRVGRQVSDVDGRVVRGSLGDDRVVLREEERKSR